MKIEKVHITGFQAFKNSESVRFESGINLIIGQNNSGKSSLLKSLQYSIPNDRHRNPDRFEEYKLPSANISARISTNGSEFREAILQRGNQHLIPIHSELSADETLTTLFNAEKLTIAVNHKPPRNFYTPYPGHGLFASDPNKSLCQLIDVNNGTISILGIRNERSDSTGDIIGQIWSEKVFYFSAERMNIGRVGSTNESRLEPSARNLPNVLSTLNFERGSIFDKINAHIREIFPSIGYITAGPVGGETEIRVWPTTERTNPELSFPLSESGTGVSQVLSILCTILTLKNAVIIIDEINSFLHPAAVKSLLRIIQTHYSDHQYIISTHSPEVISFSNPSTVHLIRRNGYGSVAHRIDLNNLNELRDISSHLGISMSDVFASDNIIWVEGPTEELCFPLLYEHNLGLPTPKGLSFVSVIATGDFLSKRRDKELIYEIYNRLSGATQPLVSSVIFSFDAEKLSATDIAKIRSDSRGKMHFLPRRHIECYMISPTAIARFVNARDQEPSANVAPGQVHSLIRELAASEEFRVPEWNDDLANPSWLAKVDAANLIAATTAQLSNHRVNFDKKADTLALLKNVMETNPEQIQELASYVRSLVDAVTAGNAASIESTN